MAVKGFFYNSINRDRLYNGQDMNEDKAPFYKEGVVYGHLRVTADGNSMKVKVDGGKHTGYAYINLHTIHNTTDLELTVNGSNGKLPRIDRVILRNDETERKPSIFILEGVHSSNPQPPELTNNEIIQEKCLAEIYVAAGAVAISQSDITDTRADTGLCGFIASQFEEFDFSQFAIQFNAWFDEKKKNTDIEWEEWFENVKEELEVDAAGNLLKLIEVERARIDTLISLEEGSTTGDAELQDIRIGADGKVYNSAGEAVRKQFDASTEQLNVNTVELLLLKKMLRVSTTTILKENTRISSKAYIDLQEVAVGQMISMSDVGSNGKSQDFADAVSLQKGMIVDITKNKAAMSCTDTGNGATYGLVILNKSSIVQKIEFIADMIAQNGFYTADADYNVIVFMPCDSEVAYELHKKADDAEDGNEVAY